jgi:uncharacterized protein YjeT (DUF2065 family)
MRRVHLIAGLVVVLLFLGTGQLMAHHEPHMAALSPEVRLLFRSRHIYLLAGALVNVLPGLYLQLHPAGWRRAVQLTGSALLILAPVLLLIAFLTEPQHGLQGKMRFGRGGIVAMAVGTLAHLLSSAGRRTAPGEQFPQ